jgi:hypothetical protein
MPGKFTSILTLVLFLGCWTTSDVFARVEVEAVVGEPFGVARVTINRRDVSQPMEEHALQIQSGNARVHYPAIRSNRLGRIVGEIIGAPEGEIDNVSFSFLFTGTEPFPLTVFVPEAVNITVTPRAQEREHRRLLERWWKDYHGMVRDQQAEGDYPPNVHTYLLAMLSHRLKINSPHLDREARSTSSHAQEILEILAGTENMREQIARESLMRNSAPVAGTLPPPAALAWPALEAPFDAALQIEPIAFHVPHDCAYIRFGKFSNFLWLNTLLDEYGGDLAKLVATRGFSQPLNEKLQTQLVLKQDALGELLGETVIADVALIGRDFFFQEGAATGVLFHAKQSALLTNDFSGKRKAAYEREKEQGATLEIVEIAGRKVSFLSTPDNRLRSFYAVDGDFHLVTTSRSMVESFYRLTAEKNSLADTAEFKHARTHMPLSRNDTVFAYLSSGFLRGLVSPEYQTELRRRLQSVVDMQHWKLAQRAARGEGLKADTIEELVQQGFLPSGFGRRPDGSGLVISETNEIDSLRGARGTFMPIADIPLQSLTPEELARCENNNRYYREHWQQMDPLFLGIQRFKLNDTGLERITVNAHVAPFEETKYGWITSMLGPAVGTRITSAPGDVIQVQAFLKGGIFDPTIGPHHMFLGVQDHVPLETIRGAKLLQILQLLRTTPGYLGAWPKTGFLDRLPLGLGGGEPDAFGYSKLLFGLWRRQGDGFSVLSFDPELLSAVTPHLAVQEGEDLAQVRVRIGNLAETRVAGLVNQLYYEQARRTSVGNARLMKLLDQQFHVPIDDAQQEAEALLNAKLKCTLGGEYKIQQWPSGAEAWASTAWPNGNDYEIPADYISPLLKWFRGLEAGLTKHPDQLLLNVQLDMQRYQKEKASLDLPLFNLFGGEKAEKKPLPPAKPLFPQNPAPPEPKPSGAGKVF